MVVFDREGKIVDEIPAESIMLDIQKIRINLREIVIKGISGAIDIGKIKAWAVPLEAGSFKIVVIIRSLSAKPLLAVALKRLKSKGVILKEIEKKGGEK